ncbi:ABC transporter ATP-binding protein [Ectobacillus antri]|jgi:ABC-2 type transport system ATP-binding protein|uniref:ABC transporter ATP-binding protein n=1 Tax=Ectobacillus antri TaxID=2486280 RepID=A0ABT6H764_9BACI|nr:MULTISPECIES: ABC transporter ATP-binding protein [Ectobacillus]MDG4657802.1 ABC transporter ATP-binding protein [Ectobacillus antri]MDG5754807.1 ABC transporter ATP-binding protein [Ectobacillus antri]UOY92266.1 ABC transporter ATP-binding protein [Ectobacillus sp. JY-23]
MEYIIEANRVSKVFKNKKAVDNISFSVEKGTVTAVLGPNGAGKTTMLSMLLGLLEPTEGEVKLFGRRPKASYVRNRMGAMLQEVSVIDSVTVGETIDLFRGYYTHPMPKKRLLEMADLEAEEKSMAHKLSGGQKRRLGFALALAGDPDLLFLDEPTVGMDIASRKRFWESIRLLAKSGKTIILTTHYLEEADQLADRIILVADGKIIADDTPEGMKSAFTKQAVLFRTHGLFADTELSSLPYVTEVIAEGEGISVATTDSDAVLRYIFEKKLPVYDVLVERGGLEDAFEKLVEQKGEAV